MKMPWTDVTNEQALTAWDKGEPIHTCEMGGLGPGYEQCIQLMGFEMLRAMITNPVADWSVMDDDEDAWKAYRDKIEKTPAVTAIIDKIGPSGAQFGAAMSLAATFARNGYAGGMDMVPEKRRIMASKQFPQA